MCGKNIADETCTTSPSHSPQVPQAVHVVTALAVATAVLFPGAQSGFAYGRGRHADVQQQQHHQRQSKSRSFSSDGDGPLLLYRRRRRWSRHFHGRETTTEKTATATATVMVTTTTTTTTAIRGGTSDAKLSAEQHDGTRSCWRRRALSRGGTLTSQLCHPREASEQQKSIRTGARRRGTISSGTHCDHINTRVILYYDHGRRACSPLQVETRVEGLFWTIFSGGRLI